MTALNQGTLSGFYLSLKGRNAWLKIHAGWSDELYAIRSTLITKHKLFLATSISLHLTASLLYEIGYFWLTE